MTLLIKVEKINFVNGISKILSSPHWGHDFR